MFGSSGMISVLDLSVLLLLDSSRLSRLTLVFISIFQTLYFWTPACCFCSSMGCWRPHRFNAKWGFKNCFFRIIAMWGGVRLPDEVGEPALREGSSLFEVVSFYPPSSVFFFSSSFLRSLSFSLSFLFPVFLAAGLSAPPQVQGQWTTSATKKRPITNAYSLKAMDSCFVLVRCVSVVCAETCTIIIFIVTIIIITFIWTISFTIKKKH